MLAFSGLRRSRLEVLLISVLIATALVATALSFTLFVHPSIASADEGLVPCSDPVQVSMDASYVYYKYECSVCDLQRLAMRILKFFVMISTVVAAILFVYAGALYVFSSANPGNVSRAHSVFTSTLIGLILILAAYLLIDVIMKSLYGADGSRWGPWNELLCVGEQNVHKVPRLDKVTAVSSGGAGSGGGTSATDNTLDSPSAKCREAAVRAPLSNCNQNNMTSVFGDNAKNASIICQAESEGNNIPSRCDRCNNNVDDTFSFGLFQINIRANRLQDYSSPEGSFLNCPRAFEDYEVVNASKCQYKCTVVNRDLYDRCKAIALDPENNKRNAYRLSRSGTNWDLWSTSACVQ